MYGSPRRARWHVASALALAFSLVLTPAAAAQSSAGGRTTTTQNTTAGTGVVQNAAPTAPTSPAPATPTPAARCVESGFSAPWWWIHMSAGEMARTFDALRDIGVTHVRFGVEWGIVQPTQGTWDWSRQDAIVDAATSRGLSITAVVNNTPSWASGGGIDRTPPKDPAQYAAFAKAAATRYAGRISSWEIWNEPNLTQHWTTGADAGAYVRLLKAAYPAIKSVQPNATVITAGLAPAGDTGENIAPATFVRQLYAQGARGYFDALGMHPYTFPALPDDPATAGWNPWYYLASLHQTMTANGDGHKKIWLTEFGAPTGTGWQAVGAETQGAIYASGLRRASEMDFLGPLFFYTLRDGGTNAADIEDNFGLYTKSWTPKTSLSTVKGAVGTYGC